MHRDLARQTPSGNRFWLGDGTRQCPRCAPPSCRHSCRGPVAMVSGATSAGGVALAVLAAPVVVAVAPALLPRPVKPGPDRLDLARVMLDVQRRRPDHGVTVLLQPLHFPAEPLMEPEPAEHGQTACSARTRARGSGEPSRANPVPRPYTAPETVLTLAGGWRAYSPIRCGTASCLAKPRDDADRMPLCVKGRGS